MTRRTHPMERLVAPLGVDKAETWVECGSRCSVRWRVTLSNSFGDTRTQAGTIVGAPPQDHTGWHDFWKAVTASMSRYRKELELLPFVRSLSLNQLKLVQSMQFPDDMQYLGDMQFPGESDFWTVQYLCNMQLAGK